ncbi:hypothetical protein [Rhodopila sp.]|uniref:hypothetical protein n=1 Tax=Rhodopila sp. TaxID=2480087 RepID=UPI003D0D8B62
MIDLVLSFVRLAPKSMARPPVTLARHATLSWHVSVARRSVNVLFNGNGGMALQPKL